MDQFIIEGGSPLRGEVRPSGNKNAALPLLAACLLTKEPVVLRNVPRIRDVLDMRELIASLGVQIEELEPSTWRVQAADVRPAELDPDLCRRIRRLHSAWLDLSWPDAGACDYPLPVAMSSAVAD